MTDPTDVIERAQAWIDAANERGINRTDKNGYLAVIEDLIAEVEFQRTALQGYRNRQIELTNTVAAYFRVLSAYEKLRSECEEWECDGLGGFALWGWWHAVDEEIDRLAEEPGYKHSRPCTCNPDDNPPVPCPKRYALSECRKAALKERGDDAT